MKDLHNPRVIRFTSQGFIRECLLILFLLIIVRLAVIRLLPSDALSLDARDWVRVVNVLRSGKNPYQVDTWLNWPPFWLQLLYLMDIFSIKSHISFYAVLRSVLIAFECVTALVLYFAILCLGKSRTWARNAVYAAVCLNPAAILQTTQHLNFDVIPTLWMLLAVLTLIRYVETEQAIWWLYAALFIGLGILTKTFPIVLLPLLFLGFYRLSPETRILGVILAIAPAALGMSVIYVLCPDGVHRNILGYRSWCESFGITGYLSMLIGDVGTRFYIIFFSRACLLVGPILIWTASKMRNGNSQLIILGWNFLLLALVVFGTGWGMQYIYWFIPAVTLLYTVAGPYFQRLILLTYSIVQATYLILYALLPVLGGFLTHTHIGYSLALTDFGHRLTQPATLTLILTPLYLCLILLLIRVVRSIWPSAKVGIVGIAETKWSP